MKYGLYLLLSLNLFVGMLFAGGFVGYHFAGIIGAMFGSLNFGGAVVVCMIYVHETWTWKWM